MFVMPVAGDRLMSWLEVLLVLLVLALPGSASACPACADAIAASSAGDDDEPSNFPRAMNQSIYLMLAVPYTTFAVVGFLIYRGCQKNAQYLAALEQQASAAASDTSD
jgi:hypothetical protein